MTIDPKKAKQMADDYTAAWNSGSAQAVAEFYAKDGGIVINRDEAWQGRDRVAQMAAGFFSDVPDIKIVCDGLGCASDHVMYRWTFTGTNAGTKKPLRVSGWEEWDLDADYKVKASRGWYDADDYSRQTVG